MQLETCCFGCCAVECTFGVPSDGPSEAFRAAHKISNRSKVHPFGLPFSGACLCQGDKLAKLQTRPLSKYLHIMELKPFKKTHHGSLLALSLHVEPSFQSVLLSMAE